MYFVDDDDDGEAPRDLPFEMEAAKQRKVSPVYNTQVVEKCVVNKLGYKGILRVMTLSIFFLRAGSNFSTINAC